MSEAQTTSIPISRRAWQAYLDQEVTAAWGDAVLIVGCFATGLLDSAVFNVWSCFVSMQTGNSVYVGLGVSGQPASQPYRWIKSGTSILAFILGSFIFSKAMRLGNPLRRSTIFLSLLAQSCLTGISALLSNLSVVPSDAGDLVPHNLIVLIPITLLSIQSGGQCVISRFLGYNEIPTVVLTSAYCDLAMDERAFATLTGNAKRNRRILSMVMVVSGAVCGGFFTITGKIAPTLWIVAAIKLVMAGVWLTWRSKEGDIRLD